MVAPLSSKPAPTGHPARIARDRLARVAHPKRLANVPQVSRPVRTSLSTSDQLWLQLPNMVIHAGLVFNEPVSRANIVELVRTRVLAMPRFRRRLALDSKQRPAWEEVHASPESHVRCVRVTGTDGAAMMQATVEDLKKHPLDPTRPPWDMTLARGDGRTCVLVTRIHHAVSDGRGLVDAILSCDETGTQGTALPVKLPRPSKSLLAPLKIFGSAFASACHLVCRRADPLTSIKSQHPVEGLSVAWLPVPWPLEDVKHIAAACGGGTVNDVVLTVVTGALRQYMQTKHDPVDKLRVRCLLPFNLAAADPQAAADTDTGNFVGGGLCTLPIHVADPRQRFAQVHTAMDSLKHSVEPSVGARIMTLFNNAPGWARRPMHRFAAGKCTVFVSNVFGPAQPMRVAGHRVDNILWFVPPLLNIGLGFPVISYEGRLSVGISANPHVVPDIDVMQTMLADEYQRMRALTAR